MKKFLVLGLCALSLAGCKTTMQDGPTKVTIEDGHSHGGDFCPPGQAKKGNC